MALPYQMAARFTDIHLCSLHITSPMPMLKCPDEVYERSVYIGKLQAIVVGDKFQCGSKSMVMTGSSTVKIEGKNAARFADMTLYGGAIIIGEPTVFIGGLPSAQ
ncbi:MAG: putative Zn-binding protein involved in type VI secretion [Phenylobacterium sp.]|jgi:uncharacterized Zn-binding protein involved in type VI secretion